MSRVTRLRGSLLGAAVGALTYAPPASAQIAVNDPTLKTNQFDIQYVEPKNPAHIPLYEMQKKNRVLEDASAPPKPSRLF